MESLGVSCIARNAIQISLIDNKNKCYRNLKTMTRIMQWLLLFNNSIMP